MGGCRSSSMPSGIVTTAALPAYGAQDLQHRPDEAAAVIGSLGAVGVGTLPEREATAEQAGKSKQNGDKESGFPFLLVDGWRQSSGERLLMHILAKVGKAGKRSKATFADTARG